MSTMSRKSIHLENENLAPDQEGRIDLSYDNIKVKMLHYPTKEQFYTLMSKAAVAAKGSIVEDNDVDEIMVEDLFKGGLNQCLEWLTVVFEVSGVTRGVTHQLVRTRKASFAQQSMRYANMGNLNVRMPEEIANKSKTLINIDKWSYPNLAEISGAKALLLSDGWEYAVELAKEVYQWMIENDVPCQDARTCLPIATETYIICSYPLSEFLATYSYRACQMFYPEIVFLFGIMKEKLIEVCPWLEPHIKIGCEKTGKGIDGLPHKCMYQGFERVEGHCTFEWALEENRVYKSRKVLK